MDLQLEVKRFRNFMRCEHGGELCFAQWFPSGLTHMTSWEVTINTIRAGCKPKQVIDSQG